MKRLAMLAMLLVAAVGMWAKPAYKISFTVDGSKDTMLLLGQYYGGNRYVLDTAWNNGKGRYVFEGEMELKPGMYYISNGKGGYVEFVVYKEKPFFTFTTKEGRWVDKMQVRGSEQNRVLIDYRVATNRVYDEMLEGEKGLDSAEVASFRQRQYERLDSVNLALVEYHPESMLARMLLATKEPQVPKQDANGNELSKRERYDWLMAHYFDNAPLDEDFIVRTPNEVFCKRVWTYVERYMQGMPPEMIIPLLDTLIDRSAEAPEVFHWLVHNLTEHYLQSNIMVYDEVYVHLVLRYFATGRAFWVPPSGVDAEVERATKWERLLVGRVAPELILFDTLHRAASLHHLPGDYALLVFWSPTCGHCREIVPGLYEVFEEYKDRLNMSAFTVLSEFDEQTTQKWRKFLSDHGMTDPRWLALNGAEANIDWHEVYDVTSTPQVYLIDNKDHTIIAKKLSADLFRQICRNIDDRLQRDVH